MESRISNWRDMSQGASCGIDYGIVVWPSGASNDTAGLPSDQLRYARYCGEILAGRNPPKLLESQIHTAVGITPESPFPDISLDAADHALEETVIAIRNEISQLLPSLSSAIRQRLAEGFGPALAMEPSPRWAIFAEDEGSATLLAHSTISKRQVSFEIDANGIEITIVRIDEEMNRTESKCELDHLLQIRNAIEWLKPR